MSMNISLEQIFSSLSDFDLANEIASAAEDKYGYDELMQWPENVPREHRVVHFIWSNTGFAETNGYVAFLMLDCHHIALPEALREVGLSDIADIVDLMIEPVIESGSLGDRNALERHFGSREQFIDWVEKFQGALFRASDRMTLAVANYCRSHQACFVSLLPELNDLLAVKSLSQVKT
jgi:hypothetical protein